MDNSREINPQVSPEHYFNQVYDEKGRFISYWHQIDEIVSLSPSSVLEIGVGNGFVRDYLKKRGVNISAIDIDSRLKPDKVGSVLQIPFPDGAFDVVGCFQVLEHLPFDKFDVALAEISRVSSKSAVLSLPDSTRAYRIDLQIPKVGEFKTLVSLPWLVPPVHEFNGEHYWEIGKAGFPLSIIYSKINKAGFRITQSYRVFEMPYHRFFRMLKTGKK